ncbi:MAG: hypothetical protein ABL876_09495 [Chitinophagaceae bacterium]
MKRVFFSVCIFGCYTAAAQQNDIFDIQKHLQQKKSVTGDQLQPDLLAMKPAGTISVLPEQYLTYTLSNGDIVTYGNGSMPCVKPDMELFSIMPNVNRANDNAIPLLPQPGQIPNGAVPKIRILTK